MAKKAEVGSTELALVETKEEHRGEYALIRQMGSLPEEQWPDARILAVRQLYGSNAKNSAQLALFLSIAAKHQLAPELNEIQLIQTNRGPKAYAGRDGFLKAASRQPHMYGGIQSGVVYEQDEFHVEVRYDAKDPTRQLFLVFHTWEPKKRQGRPHGAYAVVYDAKGRPTYVYRETKKCENLRSDYWKDDRVDDAIHNRAIGAALRRVVPLGGLLIHGEEPIGDLTAKERAVAGSTRRKLKDIRVRLGLDQEELDVDESGEPDPEQIDELLDQYATRYRVTPAAFVAWARACGTVPDELDEWTTEHKTFALQVMADTEGMEFQKELATELAEGRKDSLELLTDIANAKNREELDAIVEALYDRETK